MVLLTCAVNTYLTNKTTNLAKVVVLKIYLFIKIIHSQFTIKKYKQNLKKKFFQKIWARNQSKKTVNHSTRYKIATF